MVDGALIKEQQRRIAAFDSVVRVVNTDSAYKLWHAMLTAPNIRVTQLAMMCEYHRLSGMYGEAAYVALRRMGDTLWRHDGAAAVGAMHKRMEGESPAMQRDTCGPPPDKRAPRWLVEWTVYELPKLPPSPDSASTDP